jgi:hypothetical protein
MILPKITKTQQHILYLFYKFRFLHTNQLQILLKHKNPNYAQILLKDLKDNGYINTDTNPKTYIDRTKPAVYHLATKARHILKNNDDCNLSVLDRIYKEKTRTEKFINHCLAVVDLYLFFLFQKEKQEELNFFTESELVNYEFFPNPLPTAYIAVTANNTTSRYFLDLFDEFIPPSVIRYRFQTYLKYADSGDWEANAKGEAFPSVLFVCSSRRIKKHIYYYTKAIFEKAFEEKLELFLTTKDKIKYGKKQNIWEKVSIKDDV